LALGITEFVPFTGQPTANNYPVGTRREWRIKQETGEVRGVSIREKNKGRKSVGWLDKISPGWSNIQREYEAWRRKPRYVVGTFEQSAPIHDSQQTG